MTKKKNNNSNRYFKSKKVKGDQVQDEIKNLESIMSTVLMTSLVNLFYQNLLVHNYQQ